jgi:hypothetical protein
MSLVLLPPPKTCAELGPVSIVHPLMHLVSLPRGGTIHANMKAFAGFVSPSHPRLPNENTGHPLPFALQTPGLAELQGHLVPLCRWRSLSKSGVAPNFSHGHQRNLHPKIGLVASALARAHVKNSQESWEERLGLVAKRRPGLVLALG